MSSLDETTVDAIFSDLERLAFRGEWDMEKRQQVWKDAGIDQLEPSDGTNPEHDRFQLLTIVRGVVSSPEAYQNGEAFQAKVVYEYLQKYPGSKPNVPSELIEQVEKTVDAIFSDLESLAFRGKWNDKEKTKVWKDSCLEELEYAQGTNYAHDRLTTLMNIYSIRKDSAQFDSHDQFMLTITTEYYGLYPGSRDNIPPRLRKRIEAKIKRERQGGDSQ